MSLFSTSGLKRQERISKSAQQLAFAKSRKRHTLTVKDLKRAYCTSRRYLGSVNFKARLRWSRAFCHEFAEFFRLTEDHQYPNQPLFFVTLTDISCTTEHDAQKVDVFAYKKRLQAGMIGLSYLGMLEPGLYVNVAPGTRWSNKKAVSWHLHLICWGESREQIKERIKRLNSNSKYLGIMHSQRGAHQKKIPDTVLAKNQDRTFLADKLRYILKSPRKAYRIYRGQRITKDGEILPCLKQRKSDLRHGDRITLFHLMKKLTLDQLAVAGGDGTAVMRRIKRRAVLVRKRYQC